MAFAGNQECGRAELAEKGSLVERDSFQGMVLQEPALWRGREGSGTRRMKTKGLIV